MQFSAKLRFFNEIGTILLQVFLKNLIVTTHHPQNGCAARRNCPKLNNKIQQNIIITEWLSKKRIGIMRIINSTNENKKFVLIRANYSNSFPKNSMFKKRRRRMAKIPILKNFEIPFCQISSTSEARMNLDFSPKATP